MRTYRPTTLRLAAQNCAAAIDYYEDGVPIDRRIFGTGTAAHAMLEALSAAANELGHAAGMDEAEAVTLATGERLIRDGRTFDGKPEPPLSPDAVWPARTLVLAYVAENPIEPGAEVETGLGVDADWRPVRYGDTARFRLILDSRRRVEEIGEESSATVLHLTDYKSAWPTDADELDSIQMHSQAVVAHAHLADEVDAIRITVVNLRTMVPYSRELWMLDDGATTLRRWRDELDATMRALDSRVGPDGRFLHSPGGGCIGCPFVAHCGPGQEWRSKALEGASLEDRATSYAAMTAAVRSLVPLLKEELGERLLDMGAGVVLGWRAKAERVPLDTAPGSLWQEWLNRAGDQEAVAALRTDPFVIGYLERLGLSVSNVENAAKGLYKPRVEVVEREAFVESLMGSKLERSFGLHQTEG